MGRGRPSKYKPEYCQQIIEFFTVEPYEERVMERKTEYFKDGVKKSDFEKKVQVANPLRFISQFARKIGVNHVTVDRWANEHEEFRTALKEAKELQKEHLITCGLKGLFNPSFAIFSAKNMIGWRDERHLKGSGEGGEFELKIKIDDNNPSQLPGNRIQEYFEV